ncbi:MAG TPA: chromate efflux transporter [Acidimicrobiales bacterium]|nr:chromate efflux transporter [Acidimicrobiales bacterium]
MSTTDRPLREVALAFLRLGTIAFGGPAVHVAMMHDDMVTRRSWVGEEEFVDALGITAILPGPGSTQLSMYLGRRRAGWRGLVLGGACFILPAMVLVIVLTWLYLRYGRTVAGAGLLYGIRPVVIAVLAQALLPLARTAMRGVLGAVLGVLAFAGLLAGVDALALLGGAAVVSMLVRNVPYRTRPGAASALAAPFLAAAHHASRVRLGALFLEFLKLGIVVFGSGYVLLAFLRHDLVHGLGWLGNTRLLDLVSIGQLTPGPVFTTATAIGYSLDGLAGAAVATAAIFLPSFLLMALVSPYVTRVRRSRWLGGALDGVNAAAVGLMAGAGVLLGQAAFVDVLTVVVALAALVVLVRFRANVALVVLGGGVVGLVHALA